MLPAQASSFLGPNADTRIARSDTASARADHRPAANDRKPADPANPKFDDFLVQDTSIQDPVGQEQAAAAHNGNAPSTELDNAPLDPVAATDGTATPQSAQEGPVQDNPRIGDHPTNSAVANETSPNALTIGGDADIAQVSLEATLGRDATGTNTGSAAPEQVTAQSSDAGASNPASGSKTGVQPNLQQTQSTAGVETAKESTAKTAPQPAQPNQINPVRPPSAEGAGTGSAENGGKAGTVPTQPAPDFLSTLRGEFDGMSAANPIAGSVAAQANGLANGKPGQVKASTVQSAKSAASGTTAKTVAASVAGAQSSATAAIGAASEAASSAPDASQIAQRQQQHQPTAMLSQGGDGAQHTQTQSDSGASFRTDTELSLQRSEGRAVIDRAAQTTPRFTPQSASQLAAQITRRFNNGSRVFDIRLDPAELGRVDVRLELTPDQRVQAILTAERPETLAELQKSAKDLARALSEAGLDLADDGLNFQLDEGADQGEFGEAAGDDTLDVYAQSDELVYAQDPDDAPVRSAYGFLLTGRDRVNVTV